METEQPKYSIPLGGPTPDLSNLKAVRYNADKAILSVCIWHGQYKVDGGGTVSSESVNRSFSPEIQSTSFDSSPLSPKVTSLMEKSQVTRLMEKRVFDSLKQASRSKPLSYPWLSPFYISNFSFPCHTKPSETQLW